jgi:hypothetical protein
VEDEAGTPISELPYSCVPYAIYIYEANNRFASAILVQDASVVRNPFGANVDPAKDLMDSVRMAWEKGIALLVCTNRGVLEKAHKDNYLDKPTNSAPWFKVLAAAVSRRDTLHQETIWEGDFDSPKAVFARVRVRLSSLDRRSLLLGRDTFERLLVRASASGNWKDCDQCDSAALCPFLANRSWLADDVTRSGVLTLLSRAEVMSGQTIVFREALALISLILAGCPSDYGTTHPCDWVHARVSKEDVFSLAARRIYMTLFASYCPFGLESWDDLRGEQVSALRSVRAVVSGAPRADLDALDRVLEGKAPSTDVGVVRILGENGVLSMLDPCRDALPMLFYENWDTDFDATDSPAATMFTGIERRCIAIWKAIEQEIEAATTHLAVEAGWALRRWSSNFLLHMGALAEVRYSWKEEIDKFCGILALLSRPADERTFEEKRALRDLDMWLAQLVASAEDGLSGKSVRLTESTVLTGDWVRENLKARAVGTDQEGGLSVRLQLSEGESADFGALTYLWLARKSERNLDSRCFPQELFAGIEDARTRSAAKGGYATSDEYVELEIKSFEGRIFRVLRLEGSVDVKAE